VAKKNSLFFFAVEILQNGNWYFCHCNRQRLWKEILFQLNIRWN